MLKTVVQFNVFMETIIHFFFFFRIIWKKSIEELIRNIRRKNSICLKYQSIVTIVIFDLLNASLLNNSINFFKKKLTPHFWTGAYVYWIFT